MDDDKLINRTLAAAAPSSYVDLLVEFKVQQCCLDESLFRTFVKAASTNSVL